MSIVFVGLSGGVDSALSAALLKEQGHDVVGCFIKIWQPEFIECTWREDRLDAMRVCAALQIPFREIDLSDEYKKEVIEDMVENYRRGITPNPDVLCNRKIKFGSFAKWAFKEGADFVATGHYARIRERDGFFSLLRGIDTDKDQSYFLWQLTQEDLARTLFPVGGMAKLHVRAEATRRALPVAKKHDSQGLCFVGDISLPEFLSHHIALESGNVLDVNGRVVGTHTGAGLYTRGQRHGFTHQGHMPAYVTDTNISSNTITISDSYADVLTSSVMVSDINWLEHLTLPFESDVQVRYREIPKVARTDYKNGETYVVFHVKKVAAPGQSLVWYRGEIVLGGGYIQKAR